MRLHRLRLENFRRFRELDLEMPDGVVAIVGPNGAGKSTLLEAILFGLFGTPALRTQKDLVRTADAAPGDDVAVHLEVEAGGHAIRVTRRFSGRSQAAKASVEVDGMAVVPEGAGSMEAATGTVVRHLGLDLEGFCTTVVAQQKDLGRLLDVPARQRQRRILAMLGVDRLDQAIQEARQRRRDLEQHLAGMRAMLSDPATLRQQLQETDAQVATARAAQDAHAVAWEAARARLAQTEEDAKAARERRRRRVDAEHAAAQAEAALQAVQGRLEDAARRLHDAQEAAAEARRLAPDAARLPETEAALDAARRAHDAVRRHRDQQARLQALRARLADAERSLEGTTAHADAEAAWDAARTRQANAEARRTEARARLDRLRSLGADAPCPTCERPLEDHLPIVLAEAEAQHAEAHRLAEAEAAAVAAARKDVEEHRRRVDASQRVGDARARLEEASREAGPAPSQPPPLEPIQKRAAAARRAHEEAIAARARAQGEEAARRAHAEAEDAALQARRAVDRARAAAQAEAGDPEADAAADQAHRDAVAAERAAERGHADAVRRHDQAAAAAAACRRRLEEDSERRKEVASMADALRHWTALAGPKGILDSFRDHLSARIGPAIAVEAGRVLAQCTDGRYDEVVLDSDYNVYVTDGDRSHILERFSGGEADVVHLALRLAVGRLLAERTGAEVRLLALDEVFGSLDAERRGLVVAALQALGGLYQQVLVVTHLGELRDALDHTLELVEADGTVTVHAHSG